MTGDERKRVAYDDAREWVQILHRCATELAAEVNQPAATRFKDAVDAKIRLTRAALQELVRAVREADL